MNHMNVKNTIEVVNTCESIKDALENEYRGCVVDEDNCTVTIEGVAYEYDLIKHMDECDLSLYSITKVASITLKHDTMFDLIEAAQDILGTIENRSPNAEEWIIIRDALIEANKMRIALERISKTMVETPNIPTMALPILTTVTDIARKSLNLIEY